MRDLPRPCGCVCLSWAGVTPPPGPTFTIQKHPRHGVSCPGSMAGWEAQPGEERPQDRGSTHRPSPCSLSLRTRLSSSRSAGVLAPTAPQPHGSQTRSVSETWWGQLASASFSATGATTDSSLLEHPRHTRTRPTAGASSQHGSCVRGKCPERRWQLPPLPWPWKSLGILPPPPCCQLTVFKGRASTTQFPRPEGPAVRSCGPSPRTQPLELGPCDSRGLNACALLEAGRQVPTLCREQVYFPPGQLWEGSRHGHCRHLAVAGLQSEGSVPAGRLAAALWRPGLQLA